MDLAKRAGLAVTVLRGVNNAALAMGEIPGNLGNTRKFLRESIDWGRRHGLERDAMTYPMSQLAWAEVNSGDFDAAIALGSQMNDRIALASQTWIRIAREGPQAAIETALRAVELGARAGEAQAVIPTAQLAALVLSFAGDVEGGRSWLRRIRERVTHGQGMDWLDSGWIVILLPAALRCDELDWCVLIESAPVRGLFSFPVARDNWIAAARAMAAGDGARVGTGVANAERELRRMDFSAGGAMGTVMFLVEARRRGLPVVDAWREPIEASRAFAEKAKATWWLEELAKSGF
jgi:hypothetical protein